MLICPDCGYENIDGDEWCAKCEQPLVERNIGCAVVVSDRQVVGIFTERDALVKLNVRAAKLRDRPVSEFMTRSVETLELDDRIAFALQKMDVGGYRHIPILHQGRVMGIVSVRRILNYITAALGCAPAK